MNGQLVANWVRVFGPVITGGSAQRRWPALTAVGSFTLQPRPGNDALVVQIAVGTPRPTAIPQLWEARLASRRPGQWRSFFELHAGAPRILVTQRGSEPAAAAAQVWSDSPPRLVESHGWARSAVTGHGWPAGIRSTDDAGAHVDIEALVHAYADSRDALLRRLAHRRGHFRLPDQVNRLLNLMRMDVNGEAETADYARLIAFGPPD
jgi:hypothetical protein